MFRRASARRFRPTARTSRSSTAGHATGGSLPGLANRRSRCRSRRAHPERRHDPWPCRQRGDLDHFRSSFRQQHGVSDGLVDGWRVQPATDERQHISPSKRSPSPTTCWARWRPTAGFALVSTGQAPSVTEQVVQGIKGIDGVWIRGLPSERRRPGLPHAELAATSRAAIVFANVSHAAPEPPLRLYRPDASDLPSAGFRRGQRADQLRHQHSCRGCTSSKGFCAGRILGRQAWRPARAAVKPLQGWHSISPRHGPFGLRVC